MSGELWLVRHGETEWSRAGKHTGRTDLPLTSDGEAAASGMKAGLSGHSFAQVFTSPLRRAHDTARLAGFPDVIVDDDLAEWDYGDYEGVTTPEIRASVPGWTIWTHGCPGGETGEQVAERLDRVVAKARAADADTLVFAHGHSLCALTARWLDLPIREGRLFRLDTTTTSLLGEFHEAPVVKRWNSPIQAPPNLNT
jgi:probable phosphoglycerate mutase